MKSSEDNNFDPLLPLFWRSWLLIMLICILASVIAGICMSSLLVGILTYFLLSFVLTGILVVGLYIKTIREAENDF